MIHVVRIAAGLGFLLAVALVVGLFEWLEHQFPRVMDAIGDVFLVLLGVAAFSVLAYSIGRVFL